MPRCYLLLLSASSSLDQHTNNVSLFQLVEQVHFPAGAKLHSGRGIPLEIHAYFHVAEEEQGKPIDVRYCLRASSGLETFSDVITHRSTTPRYRTRSIGVPFPPALGHYVLCIDYRVGEGPWSRDPLEWPITFAQDERSPEVTH